MSSQKFNQLNIGCIIEYTVRPLSKRPKIDFQDQLSINAGQKYCRMLQGEHSAILSTFFKLPFVLNIFFFLYIFEWPFYTGFTLKSILEFQTLPKNTPAAITAEWRNSPVLLIAYCIYPGLEIIKLFKKIH